MWKLHSPVSVVIALALLASVSADAQSPSAAVRSLSGSGISGVEVPIDGAGFKRYFPYGPLGYNITAPANTDAVKLKEIFNTADKLRGLCPECSTGGTVGTGSGGVIQGGNATGDSGLMVSACPPSRADSSTKDSLFPMVGYVYVKEAHLKEIQRKADAWDSLFFVKR